MSSNEENQVKRELITGVPKEIGGDEIAASAEARAAQEAEERKMFPLSLGHTVIKSKAPPASPPQEPEHL